MPGVEVHHLTDGRCKKLEGVDGVVRRDGDIPMAIRRMTLHSMCDGEWLFVDSDVLVQKDVRDVFDDKAFDVALTNRDGTITNEAAYAKVMQFNVGVVFSRSPAFWKVVVQHLRTVPSRFQEWEGDQRVICALVRQGNHGFNVKILPGLKYNFPPASQDDPRLENASIQHFKGNRKLWLKQPA